MRDRVRALLGVEVFVIVTDTFGRPWREGLTNVAIGIAGFAPMPVPGVLMAALALIAGVLILIGM